MDDRRNWRKGAKNSIPLPLSGVGESVENGVNITELKAVFIGKA